MAGGRNGAVGRGARQKGKTMGTKAEKNAALARASQIPLSKRFSQLHAGTHALTKGKNLTKKVAAAVRQTQKSKRQDAVNARRGIAPSPKAKEQLKAKQTTALTKTKAGIKVNMIGRGRTALRRKKGAQGTKVGRSGPAKKDEDLDMDMDEYWHKAGKGPDPNQIKLDKQMEEYWANKPVESKEAP